MTTEFQCRGSLARAATKAPCLAFGRFAGDSRAGEIHQCALLVVSDSSFVRGEFAETVGATDAFALAGACNWDQLTAYCSRLTPDMVVLDGSGPQSAARGNQVRWLRKLLRRPMITLLVPQSGAVPADIDEVDAVLSTEFGFAPVLEALRVLVSGVVMSLGPRDRPAFTGSPAHSEAQQRLSALTGREREILSLITGGLSNREVSAQLFISPDTVKEHVSRILAKLEVTSRIEAAVVAVRAETDSARITDATRRIHS